MPATARGAVCSAAMDLSGNALGAEGRLWMFDTFRPPLATLREGLASADPAVAIAAGRALARRLDEGEDDDGALAACLPADLFALPVELITVVADLAVRGWTVAIPALPAGLAPSLAQRLRCAQLLASPEALPLDAASALDVAAVKTASAARAVASGLWERAAAHARPAMHDVAIGIARAALEGALVAPAEAQRVLVAIARRSLPAVAARALGLLAEPWAHDLPCPALDAWEEGQEVAVAAVRLAAARGEVAWLRRAVWSDAGLTARREAIAALGALGGAEDVSALVAAAEEAPAALGPEIVEALRGLKRRGISGDEADARAVLAMALGCASVPIDAAAESVSSRADALVPAIDEHLAAEASNGAVSNAGASSAGASNAGASSVGASSVGVSKARAVLFLEALGTRRAVGRLVEMAADEGDPALSRFAIRALGRLEERSAEATILARLDAEPDACLFALGRIGAAATAPRLRVALAGRSSTDGRADAAGAAAPGLRAALGGEPPAWLGRALAVLVRLDPSPEVLSAAADHEAISAEALAALPAYASLAQTEVLAKIAAAPGHPLREAAVRALGSSGGPAAIEPLGALLTDADEVFRALAVEALRCLGGRLSGAGVTLACLEDASDPGAAIVAEAALRRLRARDVPAEETALLLDAIAGGAHPHLVRVVRPYLRRASPEIKKRAAACLGAAGAVCVPWLLPSLQDTRLPVARQALIAIGRAAVPGMGPTIAAWLAHPNMNLKKTAAEAVAGCRDPQVIAPLVAALAHTDQPGYRALLEAAIQAVAGSFHRSVLVSAMVAASARGDARAVQLLAETLAGAFAPEELAALVRARQEVPQALLEHAYGTGTGQLAGKLDRLDVGLALRRMAHRIPHEEDVAPDSALRAGLARADAARRAAVLRRRVREAPFLEVPSAELIAAVRAAGDRTLRIETSLSVLEQRALAALLPQLDKATRDAAIAVLAGAADLGVIEQVLPHVSVGGETDARHVPWLKQAVARRGPAVARALASHDDSDVRRQAGSVLVLAGEDELRRAPPAERTAAVEARLAAGRTEEILGAMEGPGALGPRDVARAIAERSGAAAALAVLDRWAARDQAERTAALVELTFLGDALGPRLRAIAIGGPPGDVRRAAVAALANRRDVEPAFLRSLLDDAHPAVREEAARALLDVGDRADRARVLAGWLDGSFRGAFRAALDEQDAAAVEQAVRAAATEAEQLRLLGPVGQLPADRGVPLLLALRASEHPRAAAAARDALRALPEGDVLPSVAGALREGDLSLLGVIGATGAVSPALARLVATSRDRGDRGDRGDRAEWTAFLLRVAGTGALYAGGLGERIAAWAGEDPSAPSLSLVARLTDWFDPARAEALVRGLAPALCGSRREEVLRTVREALRDRPPALVARVLSRIVTPADTDAVRALAEAEAASPGLVETLPPPLRAAVERSLESALDAAEPEAARKLLGYFAARAERPSEREAVLALLERHVGGPSRRVSLHAHRLLRTLAPREQYLRATRALLDDTDPGTVRLAVRALAFGGDVASIGAIAERLFHGHAGVARAAREGLLALGERAVVPLERARAKLRPDRRAFVDAVLEEIRGRA